MSTIHSARDIAILPDVESFHSPANARSHPVARLTVRNSSRRERTVLASAFTYFIAHDSRDYTDLRRYDKARDSLYGRWLPCACKSEIRVKGYADAGLVFSRASCKARVDEIRFDARKWFTSPMWISARARSRFPRRLWIVSGEIFLEKIIFLNFVVRGIFYTGMQLVATTWNKVSLSCIIMA